MSDVSLEKLSLEERLLEYLAELEHEQWSHWMEYQRKQKELAWLDFLKETGKPQFDSNVMERWILLSRTPYEKLTEKEKESDREWARKALAIFKEELRASAEKIRSIFDSEIGHREGLTELAEKDGRPRNRRMITTLKQIRKEVLKELVEPSSEAKEESCRQYDRYRKNL